MELTNKDWVILDFISEFSVMTYHDIRTFVGCNTKNLQRLEANGRIETDGDIIRIKGSRLSDTEEDNLMMVLKVLSFYKECGFISGNVDEVKSMDLPFYALAKSAKAEAFLYFTVVNKGKEALQCRLIDNENHGNVVVILEDLDLDLSFTTKVARIEVISKLP